MNTNPQVLDFVKAVSDADRLRIIGVLARRPATIREVAAQLNMSFRTAFGHLGLLEFAGVVHKTGDLFSVDNDALERLSMQQLASNAGAPVLPPGLNARSRSTLTTFLKADVPYRQLPAQAPKLRVILEYLVTAFEPGIQYSEKEVNGVLRGFYPDVASARRALIDSGLLARESDGSRYWRPSDDTSTE
jgi:hypothetical protein